MPRVAKFWKLSEISDRKLLGQLRAPFVPTLSPKHVKNVDFAKNGPKGASPSKKKRTTQNYGNANLKKNKNPFGES